MDRSRVWGYVWRTLGVAGIFGVAAGGALVVRDQRRRSALTPEDVRERLQARYAEVVARDAAGGTATRG